MVHFYDNEFTKGIYVEEVNILHDLWRQIWIKMGKARITAFEGFARIVILVMVIVLKWILWCCVAFIFMVSPCVSMGLSMWQLMRGDYSRDPGGDRAKWVKLNAALDIFYILVLFHCYFVIHWMHLLQPPELILVLKQCGFGKWGPNVLGMYYSETQRKLRKDGELPNKWNLITYSVGLLQSASADDHLWGARVLDKLFDKDVSVRQELLPSRPSIQNLIRMINTDNIENSERAARILAHLASDLHISQFPGTLQCICYLLERSSCKQYFETQVTRQSENPEQRHKDPHGSLEISEHHDDAHTVVSIIGQTEHDHEQVVSSLSMRFALRIAMAPLERIKENWELNKLYAEFHVPMTNLQERRKFFDPHRHSYEHGGAKELISQALLILERLTQDEENCTEITKHQRLLSKITSPLRSREFLSNAAMVEMACKSLTVVSRLLTSPGDGATKLRQELASNKEAVSNLMAILETDDSGGDKQLHQDSLEILTELALDDSFKNLDFYRLFKALLNIFLGKDASNTIIESEQVDINTIVESEQVDSNAIVESEHVDSNAIVESEQVDSNTIQQVDRERTARLRGKAGEALARLLPVRTAAARRANVPQILSKQGAINLLTKVFDQIVSSKMGTSADAATGAGASNNCAAENVEESQPPAEADSVQPHTQGDEQISDERKLMAAMLSLALVIGKNVISKEDFAGAIPEDDAALVKKSIEILKVNKHSTAECLRVVKLTCQMVIAMIQAKSSCIQHFNDNEHKFKEELSKASETMSEIDDCMLFSGNHREVIKPARSLASLVKEAHQSLGTA